MPVFYQSKKKTLKEMYVSSLTPEQWDNSVFVRRCGCLSLCLFLQSAIQQLHVHYMYPLRQRARTMKTTKTHFARLIDPELCRTAVKWRPQQKGEMSLYMGEQLLDWIEGREIIYCIKGCWSPGKMIITSWNESLNPFTACKCQRRYTDIFQRGKVL